MDKLAVAHYAPDSELLGLASIGAADFSQKWIDVSSRHLASVGPVFRERLSGNLANFQVESAAGMCTFYFGDIVLFVGAILTGKNPARDEELGAWFSTFLDQGVDLSPNRPLLLILNTFADGPSEPERHAMFQFAYHFAAAYVQYDAV